MKGVQPIGFGSYPLSLSDASAWFANKATSQEKLLTVLVFFHGPPGWTGQETNFKSQTNGNPSTYDFDLAKVHVNVKYSPETDSVEIAGNSFDRSTNNVFVVTLTDEGLLKVSPLGTHDLRFGGDDLPPVVVLARDANLWAAVTGHPVSEHPMSQKPAASPDTLLLDTKGLRLLTTGNAEDAKEGCALLRKAAMQGYAPSQYRLGYCYQSGAGAPLDLAMANEWYAKAAAQHYVDAEYKLGYSYTVGRGVKLDLAQGFHWYQEAAVSGDSEALFNVGFAYANGYGVKPDPEKATHYFLQAALHGYPGAQFQVSTRLREGDGVSKDLEAAYSWLLVLEAQKTSFTPQDWDQIQPVLESARKELTEDQKKQAAIRSKEWMTQISDYKMIGYSRQP